MFKEMFTESKNKALATLEESKLGIHSQNYGKSYDGQYHTGAKNTEFRKADYLDGIWLHDTDQLGSNGGSRLMTFRGNAQGLKDAEKTAKKFGGEVVKSGASYRIKGK